MKLSDLIKKGSLRRVATATVATLGVRNGSTVATVATVAVANPPKQAAEHGGPLPVPVEVIQTDYQLYSRLLAPTGRGVAGDLLERLMAEGMRICDCYGDNEAAREEMRRDILATPDHLKPDLLEHFQSQRPTPMPKRAQAMPEPKPTN